MFLFVDLEREFEGKFEPFNAIHSSIWRIKLIQPPCLSTPTSLVFAAFLGREFHDDSIGNAESEHRMLTVIRG
jgi:hypothetical protein